jgi:hypothetical protein
LCRASLYEAAYFEYFEENVQRDNFRELRACELRRILLPRTPVNGLASDFYVLFREKTASDGTDWGSYAADHPLGCWFESLEGRRV